jgi:hypothetical protein
LPSKLVTGGVPERARPSTSGAIRARAPSDDDLLTLRQYEGVRILSVRASSKSSASERLRTASAPSQKINVRLS